jgi:hypothetical protein
VIDFGTVTEAGPVRMFMGERSIRQIQD